MDLVSIGILIVVILFICVLLVKRFVYFHPSKLILPLIENFEEIYEGNLHALYSKGTNNKIIVYCHGNYGNVTTRQDKIINLNKLGFSVLIFDYNGYGKSKGVPNESMCYNNGDTFIAYILRNGFTKDEIILYGEGIGGCVASYLAVKYGINVLILESALPSIKLLLKSYNSILSIFGVIFNEFNTEKFLNYYKGKLLVIHSVHDEIIPYKIIDGLKQKATLFLDSIGNHSNVQIDWDQVKNFLNS